jgi:hypothetical protein
LLLRAIHGGVESVIDFKPAKTLPKGQTLTKSGLDGGQYNPADAGVDTVYENDFARLNDLYLKFNEENLGIFQSLFAGHSPRIPETFQEIGVNLIGKSAAKKTSPKLAEDDAEAKTEESTDEVAA